jgi:hypothetical protein
MRASIAAPAAAAQQNWRRFIIAVAPEMLFESNDNQNHEVNLTDANAW